MSMRQMTAILLAVAVMAGLSIGVGRRAQRFLSDLPIVDHTDTPDGPEGAAPTAYRPNVALTAAAVAL
jgi:hypothetical protein